jgi:hypothetical protein
MQTVYYVTDEIGMYLSIYRTWVGPDSPDIETWDTLEHAAEDGRHTGVRFYIEEETIYPV